MDKDAENIGWLTFCLPLVISMPLNIFLVLSSLLSYRTLFSSWNDYLYFVHTNQPDFSCENFRSEPEVFEMQRRESEYGH